MVAATSASFRMNAVTANAAHRHWLTSVTVNVTLNAGAMWVVRGQQTDALLRHEQGHYDIVALLARDLYNNLISLVQPTPHNFDTAHALNDAIDGPGRVTSQLMDWLSPEPRHGHRRDGVYDQQTNHGLNAQAQAIWNNAFARARQGEQLLMSLIAAGIQPPAAVTPTHGRAHGHGHGHAHAHRHGSH
jgi:hypothetical protein